MENELTPELPKRKLYPTNDWIFKRIYGRKGSERITEKLIQAFLGLDVKIKKLNEEKILETDIFNEKAGIIDILVETEDGTQIDLEMQAWNYNFVGTRLTRYCCKLFSTGLHKGELYDKTRKTIAVMFIKDDIEEFKTYAKHTLRWKLREEKYHELILTDDLEIVIISLEKIRKEIEKGAIEEKEKIALWTKFLLNPSTLKGEEMESNKEIKEAKGIFEEITSNMTMAEINAAIRREEYEHEVASLKHLGYTQGLEEGKKAGKKEGKKEGIEEGIEKGKKEGEKETCKTIAKKMLEEQYEIDVIVKLTGLTKEEIEELK